jgi:hypothetical protein
LNYLARGIHSLGPAALGYLFCDLAAGKFFWPTVEAYAVLSPYRDFILGQYRRPAGAPRDWRGGQ